MRDEIFKQLWLSAIPEKPSQTCAHFCLYILLFMEAHLNKLNSPHFTEKWHFLSTISKTNIYPLQILACGRTCDQILLLCDVWQGWSCCKIQPNMHSGLLDCLHHAQHCRCSELGRGVLSAKHEQHKTTHTNGRHTYKWNFRKHVFDRDGMGKPMSFATDSC